MTMAGTWMMSAVIKVIIAGKGIMLVFPIVTRIGYEPVW
jgi:hypothetical protein